RALCLTRQNKQSPSALSQTKRQKNRGKPGVGLARRLAIRARHRLSNACASSMPIQGNSRSSVEQGGRKNGRGRLGNSARPVLALLLILRADFGSSAVERLEPGVTATCAGRYATHRDARERARQRRRRFAPHVDC